jgi:hypothetical protein
MERWCLLWLARTATKESIQIDAQMKIEIKCEQESMREKVENLSDSLAVQTFRDAFCDLDQRLLGVIGRKLVDEIRTLHRFGKADRDR